MPNQTQIPYALAKLGESMRAIKRSVRELPALRKRLEKNMETKRKEREAYGELKNQHGKLLAAISAATLSMHETGQDALAAHSAKLGLSLKSFNLMTRDYSKLCAALENYLSSLELLNNGTAENCPGQENHADGNEDAPGKYRHATSRTIGRLMNNVKMGHYPTCTENLKHIANGMNFQEGQTVNMLDPCCGCGIALRSLAAAAKESGTICKTYGIELDGHRAEEALSRLDRVGFGSFFHSRTSSEAFHAMLLNPPYLSVMTEGGSNARSEKRFLIDSMRNLMIGGLLIYIIPHYRLTPDIARVLCDNFADVTAWKFTGAEFKKFLETVPKKQTGQRGKTPAAPAKPRANRTCGRLGPD